MGSKGSQKTESTSTQKTSADPRAEALYTDVLARAQAASQTPYQAYQGQLVAGFTPDQLNAMQGVRDVQGAYAPYLQTAAAYGQRAGEYITPSDIQQAMSPYIQDVVGSTVEQANRQYLKAMSQLRGTEAQQGAFGGTRAAVAEANLAAEQQANREKLIADLMNKGYTQAVAQAQADRAAAGQGAQIMQGIAGYELSLTFNGVPARITPRAASELKGQGKVSLVISADSAATRRLRVPGVVGTMIKPIEFDRLLEIVRRYC